jgi:hypothetical protein
MVMRDNMGQNRFPPDNRYPPEMGQPYSRRRLGDTSAPRRANWWTRATAWGWDQSLISVEARERARRSQLTSVIIAALMVVALVLLPLGINDPSSLGADVALIVGLLIAFLLNRSGRVTSAGWIIVVLVWGGVTGALITQPTGLTVDALLGFDLLLIALVVAAFVLPRSAVLWVGAVNIAIIVGIYVLTPHGDDLTSLIAFYDGELGGALALLSRPIALELIIGVVAYLARRGIDFEIRRADRAEEIASLEHTLADQKRQLDIGIQQILQTHVRAANGDYTARAPLGQDNLLWQIASSLNNLLSRLQRSGQAEHLFRRVEEEARRLAAAIDDAQAGRKPIWPAPTGTPIDLILERIRGGRRAAQQPVIQEQPQASQPMSGFPAGPRSGWPEAMPQQMPPSQGGVSGWPDQVAPAQQPMEPAQNGGWPGQQPAQNGGWPEPTGDQGAQENPWAFPQDER